MAVLIAFRLQSEFGRLMALAAIICASAFVLIAFRLQSEFGLQEELFCVRQGVGEVLIAFRLQSEFGLLNSLLANGYCAFPGLNRLSASVRIWTSIILFYRCDFTLEE